MPVLALDIGNRVTGVALFDENVGFPFPLDPIVGNDAETAAAIRQLIDRRSVTTLVVGLPLLPDGTEGAQVERVRAILKPLVDDTFPIVWIDERYTSKTDQKGANSHAQAAVSLLQMALDRGLIK